MRVADTRWNFRFNRLGDGNRVALGLKELGLDNFKAGLGHIPNLSVTADAKDGHAAIADDGLSGL